MKTVIRSLTATLRSSLQVSGSTRRRRMASAFRSSALIDVLEARLLLAADLGDAPDTSSATGVENYQTLTANNGPRHTIDQTQTTLLLGAGVDGDNGAQQKMVDAKAMVALPCAGLKIPECPNAALRIMRRQRVGPALAQKRAVGGNAFGLAQGIVQHRGGRPDIMRMGNDIIVARHNRRDFRRQ